MTAEASKDSGVALSWTAPAEDAGSVTGYEVLRAQGSAELATLAADTGNTDTTYTDETASEAGETYAYQVKALRGEEKSQGSNRAEAFIPATTLTEPEPPVAALQSGVTVVPADWSLIPSGLSYGDEFRLLFVSSTGRNASSDSIATYNTWIQNRAAAGHTDIQDYSSTFTAVGSTAAVDARDNTHTTYTSSDKGVPIYWLNGNKVADHYEDFYDGDWDEEANRKEEDGTASSDVSIRTGSDHDGTEKGSGSSSTALGKSPSTVGFPNSSTSGSGPLSSTSTSAEGTNLPLYGLSGVFRVAPPPPTVVPADWSLIPSSLGEGDQFRLLFLSSTKRSIRSTNISDYNTFVQNRAAAGHTDIQDYSGTFRVLGSTDAVAARDNTHTTYTSSDKGVRIYWLNGDKAADQYEDFYDGSWNQQADAWNESGGEYNLSARRFVATGSSKDGTKDQSNPLGASSGEVQLGCLYQTSSTNGPVWCNFVTENIGADDNQQLYGLSGVFQVVTNNATGAPTISGTPEVKQTLTADISGIMDEDGLPADDQFSYQWIRSDGTDDSDISGATDSTYKVKAADLGKTIKVRVTFIDEGGTEETLTSDATAAVTEPGAALVSNVGQADSVVTSFTFDHAQSFTTGTNSAGYTLESVEIDHDFPSGATAANHAVSIRTQTSGGGPGTSLGGLTNPASVVNGLNTYTATGISLAANTTYFILVDTSSQSSDHGLQNTNSDSEDAGAESGWSIGDSSLYRNHDNSGFWASDNRPYKIRINGTVTTPSTEIPADSSLVPDGLGPGDQFRLIFLSSETRTAEATDIATYNAWVQGLAANGHADIQDHSSTFRVVGSTAAVDARDNTSTTYTSSDKGVAIYWLNGDKAADDYEDFYDETWDEEASMRDESGTTVTAPT